MENSITNNFAKTSQALADKAADKVQAGIRGAPIRQKMRATLFPEKSMSCVPKPARL